VTTAFDAVDIHDKIVDVEESNRGMGTTRVLFTFTNGWKASVIQGPYTYGGADGLFEMGVLDSNGNLDYANPVTPDDVAGYLTVEDVKEKLAALANLTAEDRAQFKKDKAIKDFRRALEYLYADFKDIRENSPDAVTALPTELRKSVEGILHYFDNQNEENNA
jgi:hypothetical protein